MTSWTVFKWSNFHSPLFLLSLSHHPTRSCMTSKALSKLINNNLTYKTTNKHFRSFQIFALLTAGVILSINIYFITDYVSYTLGSQWYIYVILAIPTTAYILFIAYLVSSYTTFTKQQVNLLFQTVYCFVACGLLSENIVIYGFNFKRDFEVAAPWTISTSSDNPAFNSSDPDVEA